MPSPSENAETANSRCFAVSNMQMSSGFPDSMSFDEHVLQTFGCFPRTNLCNLSTSFFVHCCVCCVCFFGSNSIEDTWKGNGSTEVRGLNDFQLSVGSVWDLLVDSKGEISLGLVGRQSNTPTALDQG